MNFSRFPNTLKKILKLYCAPIFSIYLMCILSFQAVGVIGNGDVPLFARPFYNSTSILELYPIVAEEYIPFVCHWFDVYERAIREEDVLVIYRLFEGNTYYMQKTFHEAFINIPIGSSCTLDILRQTVDGVLEEAGDGYRQLLSRIPERQKELLYAIASAGKAEKIMSAGFIRKYSLVSSSAVQAAARKLMELDLLTEEDNIYFIPDILFRMYLQRLKNTNIIFIPS